MASSGSRSRADPLVVGGVKVKPTAKSLVVPAKPTPEQWLSLSNLDRVVNPTFSSAILFYNCTLVRHNRTFEEIVQSLKESLANVLVDFFPLAGRLALRDDGLVDLYCSNQGAVFIEATVDAELQQVGGAQPMPALSGLGVARLGPGPLYIPDQLRPMPTLVTQVTQFKKCGSVAIAVNWHHTVADGSAGCHFMKSWSEVAMGKPISVKPDHNREQLMPRNPPDSSLIKGYSTLNVQDLLPTDTKLLPHEPPILKLFPITKQELQAQKAQARTDACEYTSAEAIAGHLWKATTKARRDRDRGVNYEQVERVQTTRFFMFVDGRRKLKLSSGYFGNVVCSACAEAKEDDILKNPVSYAADLIRKATRNASDEYFRSLIDWVEEQGSGHSKSEHVNSMGHDVAATFWTAFPLYQMDFGWGNPDFAARNSAPRPLIDGIAMMPSPEGLGNMVAILNLHGDRMERVEKDSDFLNAAESVSCNRMAEKDSEFLNAVENISCSQMVEKDSEFQNAVENVSCSQMVQKNVTGFFKFIRGFALWLGQKSSSHCRSAVWVQALTIPIDVSTRDRLRRIGLRIHGRYSADGTNKTDPAKRIRSRR